MFNFNGKWAINANWRLKHTALKALGKKQMQSQHSKSTVLHAIC
jgi:hypothetical protein